jgi:hypothetical protein
MEREWEAARRTQPRRCEYYFFANEGIGGAATRTIVLVVKESEGLTITLSDCAAPLSALWLFGRLHLDLDAFNQIVVRV